MKVDLWIVLIWPVVVFLAGTIVVALARAGWLRVKPQLSKWRDLRHSVRDGRRAARDKVLHDGFVQNIIENGTDTIKGIRFGDIERIHEGRTALGLPDIEIMKIWASTNLKSPPPNNGLDVGAKHDK